MSVYSLPYRHVVVAKTGRMRTHRNYSFDDIMDVSIPDFYGELYPVVSLRSDEPYEKFNYFDLLRDNDEKTVKVLRDNHGNMYASVGFKHDNIDGLRYFFTNLHGFREGLMQHMLSNNESTEYVTVDPSDLKDVIRDYGYELKHFIQNFLKDALCVDGEILFPVKKMYIVKPYHTERPLSSVRFEFSNLGQKNSFFHPDELTLMELPQYFDDSHWKQVSRYNVSLTYYQDSPFKVPAIQRLKDAWKECPVRTITIKDATPELFQAFYNMETFILSPNISEDTDIRDILSSYSEELLHLLHGENHETSVSKIKNMVSRYHENVNINILLEKGPEMLNIGEEIAATSPLPSPQL